MSAELLTLADLRENHLVRKFASMEITPSLPHEAAYCAKICKAICEGGVQ
ncbi:hypothetical protein [Methanosarcina horonobensis]|nr:hypothetical protein [Methanosarcina horonobensis]